MKQGIFPFQYEVEKKPGGMTALAGLPTYLEFGYVMGLSAAIESRLKIRGGDQGWSDCETIMALILLNLADGQGVSDLDILEGDEGFCRVLRESVGFGKSRQERRALKQEAAQGTKEVGAFSFFGKPLSESFPCPRSGEASRAGEVVYSCSQ